MKIITSILAAGILLSGCSQQEPQLTQALVGSASKAAVSPDTSVNHLKTLSSPAGAGMAQSQVIGAQMLMNPGVIGAGALGMAVSEHNKAQNKAAFGELSALMANTDQTNTNMENRMLQAYNKQNGTHFGSMMELQEATKIAGYNEKYGTHYTKLGQVRIDYNKRKGTDYKTDKEFREFIHGKS